MKKFSYIFILLATVIAVTACKDDDRTSEYQFQEQTYYRIIDNAAPSATPYFARGTVNATVDYVNYTISFSTTISLNGNQITIEVPVTKCSKLNNNTYKFTGATAKTTGHNVTNVAGYYDMATNAMYFEMDIDGAYRVYATSTPLFPYCTTTITQADNSIQPLVLDNTFYGFMFDQTLSDGLFAIMNFQLNNVESSIPEVDYKGVTVKPTPTGFEIQADILTPSSIANAEKYTITNVKATIANQGITVTGSYSNGDKNVTFSGKAFDLD